MGMGEMHHIVVDVANLERSEEFYGQALGLPPQGRDLWPGEGRNASYALGTGTMLVLMEVAATRPDPPGVHTRLIVSEAEWPDLVGRLQSRGYPMRDERKAGLRAVGEAGLNVTDPDGHVVELEMHSAVTFEVPAAGRGKILVGRIDEFAVGSVTRIAEGQFFLVRLADGFLAVSQVCTHMQFAVTYQPEHFRFYCPRHRRRFNRTGKYQPRFGMEDTPPLRVYAIEFVDGQVIVDTDASIARRAEEAGCLVAPPTPIAEAATRL
jgi:catechol 2,3-dioxygenase-like lactoylglutathione lyase family enzyme/nitrite reductase/ring-hydroxylating ferredoxin subunit